MNPNLKNLPIDQKIQLVEDLWDSIAAQQTELPLTIEQRTELDKRLSAFEKDGNKGHSAEDVIQEIRSRL